MRKHDDDEENSTLPCARSFDHDSDRFYISLFLSLFLTLFFLSISLSMRPDDLHAGGAQHVILARNFVRDRKSRAEKFTRRRKSERVS